MLQLSHKQKEYNKNHSKKRIVIEHIIGRLKKYRGYLHRYIRNKLRRYNQVSDIVSGLINYRIMRISIIKQIQNPLDDANCF